jgi:hypothetical protein
MDEGGRSRWEHAIESNAGAIAECVPLAQKVRTAYPTFEVRKSGRKNRKPEPRTGFLKSHRATGQAWRAPSDAGDAPVLFIKVVRDQFSEQML